MNDISVIIPLYKGIKYIDGLIEMLTKNISLLPKQLHVELLLVNDYPKDKISVSMSDTVQNFELKIINNEDNVGIHASRIIGIQKATGKYVYFLDQDDKIADEYLLSQWQSIGNADVVVCNGVVKHKLMYPNKTMQERLMHMEEWVGESNLIFSPGQAFIKKDAIPQVWLTTIMKMNGADDYFLWLCMLQNNAAFKINEKVLFYHFWHGNNTSSSVSNMKRSLTELYNIVENLNFLPDLCNTVKKVLNNHEEAEKNRSSSINSFLTRLVYSYQNNISLEELMINKNYSKIAIYGMGLLGNVLCNGLCNSSTVQIVCGIDKNAEIFRYDFPVYKPTDPIPYVDAVIVTVPSQFDEIACYLKEYIPYEIISIENILG